MTTATTIPSSQVTPYQFFMLALCAWALLLLGAGSLVRLEPETSHPGHRRHAGLPRLLRRLRELVGTGATTHALPTDMGMG